MAKKIKILFLTTLIVNFFIITLLPIATVAKEKSWVETVLGQPLIPDACTKKIAPGTTQEGCGLTQVFQTIINFSQLILALTGSAALLMFTYGGVLWILAAGKQEMIQQGKSAIIAAAIGLTIVLAAWMIVNFTIVVLTGGEVGGTGTIFNQFWYKEQNTVAPQDMPGGYEPAPQ